MDRRSQCPVFKSQIWSQKSSRKSQISTRNSKFASLESQVTIPKNRGSFRKMPANHVTSRKSPSHKSQTTQQPFAKKKKKKSQLASRKSPLPSPLAVPLLFPSRHLPLTRFAVRKFEGQLWPSQYANLPIKCRVEAILTTLR